MKNKLINNAVKAMEWQITTMINERIGMVYYTWESSPVTALRGGKSQFSAEIKKAGEEKPKVYNGTVFFLCDGKLDIKLQRIEVCRGMTLNEEIHLY